MNKIAVMFPGQASQYVGMGKQWYKRYELVRRRFSEASEILGFDMANLCFQGPADLLKRTENTQVALLTLSVAMFEAAQKEEGLRPSFLAGHSIGELSALTAASVFSFADAVKLTRIRGEAMSACPTESGAGMIAAIKIEATTVQTILEQLDPEGKLVQIANYNSPKQTILSGNAEGLRLAGERMKEAGATIIPLNVSGPFHSRFMAHASNTLNAALESIPLRTMKIPVMCGQEGRPYAQDDDIKAALVAQLTGPVRWTDVLLRLSKEGVDMWLEMGPKDVLKKLTLQTFPSAEVYSYDDVANDKARRAGLDSFYRRKAQTPNLIGLCTGAAVCTRNNNWNEEAYKEGVIMPYKELQSLFVLVEKEDRIPNREEMGRALALLKKIFQTKGTTKKEQIQRFKFILNTSEAEELFPEYLALAEEG